MCATCPASACTSAAAQNDAGEAEAPASDEIQFDHTIHAGDNEIPCLSCHAAAARSPVAGVPSLNVCMGCHRFVAKDRPKIQALSAMFDRGEAPSWPRVYDLPDYVYFTHRMHIRAGLECSECHGAVETMKTVRRVSPLDMGWCMDCHRQRGASTDCETCHK